MRRLVLFFLLLILVILTGCSNNNNKKNSLEKKPILVKVEKVKMGIFIKTLSYKGTVSPWKRANIVPDVSGRIGKIYKKQGDVVKKGELLAELDTTTLKLQLEQATAALGVAKASYKDALVNYRRLKKLHEKDAISQMQYEKAQLNLEAADTQKKSAEANLNVIKHTLDNSYMKAPFDGIITTKYLEEGDMINPMMGMVPGVLALMDLSKVKIILNVPSEDIEKIQVGQSCKIQVSSLTGEIFFGTVYSKNFAADPVSKTFQVEVVLKNPGIKIKAGVFAEVSVEILRKENTVLIPVSALTGESYVVLYDNGKAAKKEVKVGDRNENECEILNGLSGGELLVVEGNYDLKEGSPIVLEGENK